MARDNSKQTAIKDVTALPPTRTHMDADGIRVTEKLNPMRVNRKMVHPDGDVVVISLATGWAIDRLGPKNPYGLQIQEEKLATKRGFLPFDECPVATGRVPAREGDEPCKGKFSDAKCCPHLDRIMQKRREAHRKQQESYRRSSMSPQAKIAESISMQAAGAAVPDSAKGKGMPRG